MTGLGGAAVTVEAVHGTTGEYAKFEDDRPPAELVRAMLDRGYCSVQVTRGRTRLASNHGDRVVEQMELAL